MNFSNANYYDPEVAERPIAFAEKHLVHVKGPLSGQSWKLEEWQKKNSKGNLWHLKTRRQSCSKNAADSVAKKKWKKFSIEFVLFLHAAM